jgi:hypothetical protein
MSRSHRKHPFPLAVVELPVLRGAIALALGAWASTSCAPGGFRNEETISSVRILASSADPPYAKPGDSVTMHVLAVDGRASRPSPMQVYWLAAPDGTPFVCENPPDDAYYACFQKLGSSPSGEAGAGVDGGTSGHPSGGSSPFPPPGVALPIAPGTTTRFKMPLDAVTSHARVPGTPVPYGTAILFNIACAGHLEFLPYDPNDINPVKVPIGCFDAAHNRLGPDDYVFGFTRVYAYEAVTNANPVIDHVDVDGQRADLVQGFPTAVCTTSDSSKCPAVHIGPVVPPSSWETNPEAHDANGNALHEEIWTDFYATAGQFNDSARLLYDARTGSLGGPSQTDNQFDPPQNAGDGSIWIVVHDSRGGAAWVRVPFHAK